jgi:ABC-type multidrug transport system ATPase subunit/pSer/pThr/pTyr-binding forkhead associated (FHA) protein
VLDAQTASRAHARITEENGAFVLEDLGSAKGTRLNGHPLDGERHPLKAGDEIEIEGITLRYLAGPETRLATRGTTAAHIEDQVVACDGGRLTIGRDASNSVVLDDPNVSRFHAELVSAGEGIELRDLGSRNGTRLDGAVVESSPLAAGGEIGVGPYSLRWDGARVHARDDRGALRLEFADVELVVGDGKRILSPVSGTLDPGTLTAIIGESGAGKSTLLKILAGVNAATGGRVTVNGAPLAGRLTDIGYVPQDDIVHSLLTVREALTYAARLRLPGDVTPAELEATVERVLGELALGEHADKRIANLSGGQRKRTSVASELLARPSVLFLDEPTTGLDPGLETKTMELLRSLADNGRAVAVVTHATKNLSLCDQVIVMGRGGELAYAGPPAEALAFFGVDEYDGIYTALDESEPGHWHRRFAEADPRAKPELAEPAAGTGAGGRHGSYLSQAQLLTSRYLKLFARDRLNVLLLVGQVPILSVAGALLFKSGLYNRGPTGSPADGLTLLFLTTVTTIWFGAIDSAREVVRERAVFDREAAIGTRVSAYVTSKLVVLLALVTLQVILNAAVVWGFRPLHAPFGDYVQVLALLSMCGMVAIAMGLVTSSLVASEDQAVSVIPLLLIPQLLFMGGLAPLARMGVAAKAIADTTFGQYAFAGIGTSLDFNQRLADSPEFSRVNRYGTHFFDQSFGTTALILAGFFALFMAGVVLSLRRRRPA